MHQTATLVESHTVAEVATVMEKQIRSAAAEIINRNATRQAHPTFGVTKTGLRLDAAKMDGMVALLAVVTAQAAFVQAPQALNPEFLDPSTDNLVRRARTIVRSL